MSGPEDWDIDKKIKKNGPIGMLPVTSEYIKASSWKQKEFIVEQGVDPNGRWNAIFHNESKFILKKYLSKKKYYSKSMDTYISKWGQRDPDIRKQLGLWYRFFWVFLEKGKWKYLLEKPHLIPGIYLLRILVGLQFLRRKFL
jgi:hypothetical protein